MGTAEERNEILTFPVSTNLVPRSELPPSPASLAVGSTPRVKRTCFLALMNVRNASLVVAQGTNASLFPQSMSRRGEFE